jgi:hypothetical protein
MSFRVAEFRSIQGPGRLKILEFKRRKLKIKCSTGNLTPNSIKASKFKIKQLIPTLFKNPFKIRKSNKATYLLSIRPMCRRLYCG